MLEFYQAYANYHDLMDLTEELIKEVALAVNGTTKTTFNDVEIDLANWTKLSMREAIRKFWNDKIGPQPKESIFDSQIDFSGWLGTMPVPRPVDTKGWSAELFESEEYLNDKKYGVKRAALGLVKLQLDKGDADYSLGKAIAETFEIVAEEHLIQPTIIYDFPLAVSPLSKKKPDEPDWVERFEFYIGGFEVGNAFSELNDPEDQRQRFEEQVKAKAAGDPDATSMDEDYVRALSYGLPPTAGEGIGIDRLTMILTGSKSIRDVILFPLLRPRSDASEQ
jgi:lysyl-tRNA synthetase class 2